jgi:hypothetical protein
MRVLMSHVVRDHLLLGALVAALLAPWQGAAWAAVFWAASILVDVDHHLHFLRFAGWSRWLDLRGMFRFNAHLFAAIHRSDMLILEVFHTAEALALLAALAWGVSPLLQPVFWGMCFHLAVDVVHLSRLRALGVRPWSFAAYAVRASRLRREEIDPTRIPREAAARA